MREGAGPFRRAKSLSVCWRDGRLLFHNYAAQSTISARPVTCEVLNFFSHWRTVRAAVTHFSAYSKQSVVAALADLLKRGLLVAKGSPEAARDSLVAREWSSWLPEGSFHFSTKDAPYVRGDRSNARLAPFLLKTPQPAHFKVISEARRVALPPRIFPDCEFIRVLMARRTHRRFSSKPLTLESVSQLLSLVWGFTGYLHSPLFGKLPAKTSPSGGARHPGEVYLMALRVQGLRPGLYHYHPAHHRLERIHSHATRGEASRYCAYQDYVKNAGALFLMTAVFGRTMWKYRHARAYRVVLLEAGHLCQTFCLAATWLGLAPFCTAALKDTLIEKDLGIDGVRESILYVAGVGLPSTSERVKRQFSRTGDHRAMNPNRGEA